MLVYVRAPGWGLGRKAPGGGHVLLDIGDAILGSRPCCIIFCGGHTLDPPMRIVNEMTWGAKREDAAGEEKHAFIARTDNNPSCLFSLEKRHS
jgi:hypothetical protein